MSPSQNSHWIISRLDTYRSCMDICCIHSGWFYLWIHGNSLDSQINKLFIKIQIVRINLHQSQHQSINFQTFMESATERPSDYEAVITVWCHSHVILRYFHLTTFFWMFLEGTIVEMNFFEDLCHRHNVERGQGVPWLESYVRRWP